MALSTMYALDLHQEHTEALSSTRDLYVTRVPGGWIYTFITKDLTGLVLAQSSAFVPKEESREFAYS